MASLRSILRNYFTNTSLHGFRFVAQPGQHLIERILWAVLCLSSWIGSAFLVHASWDSFQNKAVSFMVETNYLNENTSFPSVSVCEDDNMERVLKSALEIFGEDHSCDLEEVLKEIAYFKGMGYYMKDFCFSGDLECPSQNLTFLANQVRSTCEELFHSCYWMDKKIDCCKHFMPLETELGTCFSFNQKFERRIDDAINTDTNRKTGLPRISIKLNGLAKIYLHSENDVPFLNAIDNDVISLPMNTEKIYSITVVDTENPPGLRDLTVEQRKCRFGDENYLGTSDVYSYPACIADCRRLRQLEICNCTSHLMPKATPGERCDLKGLLCLNEHYSDLMVQKASWQKEGLGCDCLPGCNEIEINTLTVISEYLEENFTSLHISFERFPTQRFKRNILRSRLDLVVSMGGAAGLFVGASLLSFFEIFYFFLFRTHDHIEGEEENTRKDKEKDIKDRKLKKDKVYEANSLSHKITFLD